MIFPKIKESIKNSEFFRKNNIIPIEFYSNYKKIKNNYIKSKNEIRNKLKEDLVNFIDCFLMFNIDEECIEDYVLDLIHEFGFDDINNFILNSNDHIINKVENLKSIRLLKNDTNNEKFIYDHCTPEYYIKNKNKLDKNKLKNRHMNIFFNNLNNYRNLLKSKISFGIDITKHNYFIWVKNSAENLDKLFIDAIKNNNIKCAEKIFENGANINTDNDKALRMSSKNGYIDIVKYLVEKGANIHADDNYALRMSSENGHIDIVKFLVLNGANIHAKDDYALRKSSQNGHIEVVKYLVEKGANINVFYDYALAESSRNGHIDVVKFLVGKGANIHERNDYALTWSSINGHIEIVKFLIQSDINYFKNNQLVIPIIQKHRLNEFFNNIINDTK